MKPEESRTKPLKDRSKTDQRGSAEEKRAGPERVRTDAGDGETASPAGKKWRTEFTIYE